MCQKWAQTKTKQCSIKAHFMANFYFNKSPFYQWLYQYTIDTKQLTIDTKHTKHTIGHTRTC